MFCAGYMLCEMVAKEERTQIAGLTMITDGEGFGMKQMLAVGLDDVRQAGRFFNICFPLWLRQLHIVNTPR